MLWYQLFWTFSSFVLVELLADASRGEHDEVVVSTITHLEGQTYYSYIALHPKEDAIMASEYHNQQSAPSKFILCQINLRTLEKIVLNNNPNSPEDSCGGHVKYGRFSYMRGVSYNSDGSELFFATRHHICSMNTTSFQIQKVVDITLPLQLSVVGNQIYFSGYYGRVLYNLDISNGSDRSLKNLRVSPQIYGLTSVTTNALCETLYFSERFSGSTDTFKIYTLDMSSGNVTLLAGNEKGVRNGNTSYAQFSYTEGMLADPTGSYLYVCDSQQIRVINLQKELVFTLAGDALVADSKDGTRWESAFNSPLRIVSNNDGSVLYVLDAGSKALRKIEMTFKPLETPNGSTRALTCNSMSKPLSVSTSTYMQATVTSTVRNFTFPGVSGVTTTADGTHLTSNITNVTSTTSQTSSDITTITQTTSDIADITTISQTTSDITIISQTTSDTTDITNNISQTTFDTADITNTISQTTSDITRTISQTTSDITSTISQTISDTIDITTTLQTTSDTVGIISQTTSDISSTTLQSTSHTTDITSREITITQTISTTTNLNGILPGTTSYASHDVTSTELIPSSITRVHSPLPTTAKTKERREDTDCGSPPMIENATSSFNSTVVHAIVTYQCIVGWVAVAGNETAVCSENKLWVGGSLKCHINQRSSVPLENITGSIMGYVRNKPKPVPKEAPATVVIPVVGINLAIILSIIGAIILSDLLTLQRHLKRMKRNLGWRSRTPKSKLKRLEQ